MRHLWCQLSGMGYEHGGTFYFELIYLFMLSSLHMIFLFTLLFEGFSCSYTLIFACTFVLYIYHFFNILLM